VVVAGGGTPGGLTHRRTRLPGAAWLPGRARSARPGRARGGAGRVGVAAGPHLGGQAGLVEQVAGGLLGLAEDLGDQCDPERPGALGVDGHRQLDRRPRRPGRPPAGNWANTVPGAAASSTRSRCTSDSPASSSHPTALTTGTPTIAGTSPATGRSGSRQVPAGAAR
jgi:hypothetical protein